MAKRKRVQESDDEYSDNEDDNVGSSAAVDSDDEGGAWEEHEEGTNDNENASNRYKKLDQIEHILLRPETYIGSVESEKKELWVFDTDSQMLVQREIRFVPGLYKIFDEILVNAADNKIRDKEMNRIDVTIDAATCEISVKNNGKGIPIEMHTEHGVYIPTMIFGMLLTGDNFNDSQKRVTGGRNGYGAKLCNIFSTEFSVETVDSKVGKKFKQVWKKNMSTAEEPKITSCKTKDYTMVTFKPDLKKFGMSELDADIVALMSKRVYDIAGTTGVNVYLNGNKIKVKSFKDYVKMYALEKKMAFEVVNERWSVGVTLSDGTPQQVSFVNSICTTNGGKHVDHITSQIVKHLKDKLNKKNKGAPIKPQHIKNQIFVFVNSLIINPTFDSQTKDTLTTNVTKFGSKCTINEDFMKQIAKLGLEDAVLRFAESKTGAELKKQSGSKKLRLTGISKLDDANDAGTRSSDKCTLILTEGDSAKALAVAGLSVIGRDKYGVFPLKGKPLNVRDCATSKVTNNEEIKALTKIMGLQHQKSYTKEDIKKLRYGSIMIMADQDHDGSHIKGLIINWIHKFWPSLLQVNGFMKEFITPIIKATHKRQKKELSFFSIPEYTNWKDSIGDALNQWEIKYYKGLGTSTAKEAKEYFNNMAQHQKSFRWEGEDSQAKIVTAFAKDKVDERKKWLAQHKDGTEELDQTKKNVKYSEFFDREFVLFSLADCARSIPSMVDGLKPGQRKILFACFKRNLNKEIKVAQLSGYVAEHSAYHHGEASLAGTIVGMAQNFVGANNINLLVPSGQFGTRLQGGKDAASARYIFTKLAKLTRCIFAKEDDEILDYLNDDGQSIEPSYYVPILPLALVNGSEGIGTAWSTFIPNYNPRDIVDNLKRLIKGEEAVDMTPWFKGFEGDTAMLDLNKWETRGKFERIDDHTIKITELPVRVWTQSYKEQLEKFIEEKKIEEFRENHTDITVSFTVSLTATQMKEAEKEGIDKYFKLSKKLSTTNMTLFAADGSIKTYSSTHEILKEFYELRKRYYVMRKDHMLSKLRRELDIISNKVRFILAVISGDIVIKQRKKVDILTELKKKKYSLYPKNEKPKEKVVGDVEQEESDENEDSDENDESTEIKKLESGYSYLVSMPLMTLSIERVKKLENEKLTKEQEIKTLTNTTTDDMWIRDLDNFLKVLTEIEDHESKEELEYLQKLAKKKGSKVEVRERKIASTYRPAPIIEVKKEKKTRATAAAAVKKEETTETAKGKQTKLSFKKKVKEESEDEEDEEDDEEEEEVVIVKRSQPSRTTRGKAKVVEKTEDDDDDEDEEEFGGSLLDRLKQKSGGSSNGSSGSSSQQIESSMKMEIDDDDDDDDNEEGNGAVHEEEDASEADDEDDEEEEVKPKRGGGRRRRKDDDDDDDYDPDNTQPAKITRATTRAKRATTSTGKTSSTATTAAAAKKQAKAKEEETEAYYDQESPVKIVQKPVISMASPPPTTKTVSRANKPKRRRIQSNTLDSYLSPAKTKTDDEDDLEINLLDEDSS